MRRRGGDVGGQGEVVVVVGCYDFVFCNRLHTCVGYGEEGPVVVGITGLRKGDRMGDSRVDGAR